MSLANHDVIDCLSVGESGRILLTVADDLDWLDESRHIEALQEKLNTYLAAIESGQVHDLASDAAGSVVLHSAPVAIEIVAAFPWPRAGAEFLAQVKQAIAGYGVELTTRVFPPSQAEVSPAKSAARELCGRAIAYLKPSGSARSFAASGYPTEEDAPLLRDLANGLVVAYLVDQGDHFEFVQYHHLRAADLDEDTIHALAVANLALHAREHAQVISTGDIFAVVSGGNFEASYLLLDNLWDEDWRELVAGSFAAVVPARDVLAFGDCESPAATAQLREVVARAGAGKIDHRLIDAVLTRVDGRWRRTVAN